MAFLRRGSACLSSSGGFFPRLVCPPPFHPSIYRALSSTPPPVVTSASSPAAPAPVGILMLNMGGPSSLDGPVDGVEPFLMRLFGDGEIIKMGPLQPWLVRGARLLDKVCIRN